METLIIILAIVAGIVGIVGSIIPGIPGPPISWIGMLILFIWGSGTNYAGMPMGLWALVVWGVIVAIVTVVDYIVPMYLTKATGGSKYAEWGAVLGMIAGIFLTPIGMILGSFLGALIAEMIFAKKDTKSSLKAALGTFIGFLLGTGIKTIVAVLIMWRIIAYAF